MLANIAVSITVFTVQGEPSVLKVFRVSFTSFMML